MTISRDRALDRAVQLASEWRCTLLALKRALVPCHAFELPASGRIDPAWRHAIASALLGSTAATLLDWLPCDTLPIRSPAGRA